MVEPVLPQKKRGAPFQDYGGMQPCYCTVLHWRVSHIAEHRRLSPFFTGSVFALQSFTKSTRSIHVHDPHFTPVLFDLKYQALFSRKCAAVRQRVTVLTDERVKLTNQVITGARLMKLNAWEPALEKEIQK